jgi:hypothetical protein
MTYESTAVEPCQDSPLQTHRSSTVYTRLSFTDSRAMHSKSYIGSEPYGMSRLGFGAAFASLEILIDGKGWSSGLGIHFGLSLLCELLEWGNSPRFRTLSRAPASMLSQAGFHHRRCLVVNPHIRWLESELWIIFTRYYLSTDWSRLFKYYRYILASLVLADMSVIITVKIDC